MKKSEIYGACVLHQKEKIEELQNAIDKVQESIIGEENSTAGNKFETARAMGQEELDRLNQTINHAIRDMNILNQIDGDKPCGSAQLGALIETDKKKMYLSVGIGKVELGSETIFAISASSPIGQQLMGMEAGGTVTFAGKKEKIVKIY